MPYLAVCNPSCPRMARVKRHPVQTAANYPLLVAGLQGMAFLTRRPQISQVKRCAPVTDRYPVVNLGCWPLLTKWQAVFTQGLLGQLQTAQPLPPSRLVDIGVFSHILCLVINVFSYLNHLNHLNLHFPYTQDRACARVRMRARDTREQNRWIRWLDGFFTAMGVHL